MTPAARRGWISCIAVAVAFATASGRAEAEPSAFRRGIGMSHSMAWAEVGPSHERAFVFPPFADRPLLAAELHAVRRAGFDFVRFAVDPGPFMQFQGAQRERVEQMLLEQVRLILSAGLSVIVDLHPGDLHPDYTGHSLTRGVETRAFRNYLQLVERIAVILDRLKSRRVGLELMNEPPGRTEAWQPMLEAAYRAARRRAPGLLLVLTGAQDGMPEGLLTLTTAAFRSDPAVLYTFHYYEPFQFTHQGASWNAARHLADVPYPASVRPLQDTLDATAAAITAAGLPQSQKLAATQEARRHLESYRRSGFDRVAVSRSFDRVVAWARDNNVPANRIFLGEFGALKSGRQTRIYERRQWFADVRAEADKRGFAWAAWVYRGAGGFALVKDERGPDIDPALIEELGLRRQARGAPTD